MPARELPLPQSPSLLPVVRITATDVPLLGLIMRRLTKLVSSTSPHDNTAGKSGSGHGTGWPETGLGAERRSELELETFVMRASVPR